MFKYVNDLVKWIVFGLKKEDFHKKTVELMKPVADVKLKSPKTLEQRKKDKKYYLFYKKCILKKRYKYGGLF